VAGVGGAVERRPRDQPHDEDEDDQDQRHDGVLEELIGEEVDGLAGHGVEWLRPAGGIGRLGWRMRSAISLAGLSVVVL